MKKVFQHYFFRFSALTFWGVLLFFSMAFADLSAKHTEVSSLNSYTEFKDLAFTLKGKMLSGSGSYEDFLLLNALKEAVSDSGIAAEARASLLNEIAGIKQLCPAVFQSRNKRSPRETDTISPELVSLEISPSVVDLSGGSKDVIFTGQMLQDGYEKDLVWEDGNTVHLVKEAFVNPEGWDLDGSFNPVNAFDINDSGQIVASIRNDAGEQCLVLLTPVSEPVVTQTIPLTSGWNWISFSVFPEDTGVGNMLKTYSAQDGDIIKNSTESVTYAGGQWYGSMNGGIKPGLRYLLKAGSASPGSLRTEGSPADTSVPVSISAGWNWIGFIPQNQMSPSEALGSLSLSDGDILKNSTESATYADGEWYGMDGGMKPGMGYLLKASGSGTLTYPPGKRKKARRTVRNARSPERSAPADWTAPSMQNNMTVYAQVQTGDGTVIEADGSMLAVFRDGQCRGAIAVMQGPAAVGKLFQLTPVSDGSSDPGLTLKVYDAASGQIYDIEETLDFESNGTVGSIMAPETYHAAASSGPGTCTLTMNASPQAAGEITASPDKTAYSAGETVILSAAPDTCHEFTGWSGACSGTSCEVVMDDDKTVTANFTSKTFSLNIAAENGSVSKTPDQASYDCLTQVTLEASPDSADYKFVRWEGDMSGTDPSHVVTMSGDMNITAVFEKNSGDVPDWTTPSMQNNMTVYAQVQTGDGTVIEADGSMLAVFRDGQCRGAIAVMQGPAAVGKLFQLTPVSDGSSDPGLTLKVYDAASGQIYDIEETLDFESNGTVGTGSL